MNELQWLEGYYSFLMISGLGDDGEIVSKVRRRITNIKIDASQEDKK